MGQKESKADGDSQLSAHDFAQKVEEAVVQKTPDVFKDLWLNKYNESMNEDLLLNHGIMSHIRTAYQNEDLEWRKAGIQVAAKFFKEERARRKLNSADFVGSVLLITLPEATPADADQEVSQADVEKKEEEQQQLQLLAARTFRQMAQVTSEVRLKQKKEKDKKETSPESDFLDVLCDTAVLNFLCIVLNQVPQAQEIVTDTFVKLSDNEQKLIVLNEGAMGDLLETFFKTVKIKRPKDEDEAEIKQWRIGTLALSNTAHALATLVRYNHPCQVDMPTIIKVFSYSLAVDSAASEPRKDISNLTDIPDNIQLLAEVSKLFFWKCRHSQDKVELMKISAPPDLNLDLSQDAGLDYVLKVLVTMWKRCVATHELVNLINEDGNLIDTTNRREMLKRYGEFCVDDLDRKIKLVADMKEGTEAIRIKKAHANMRLCYLNCTLWLLLPIVELRWKLRKESLDKMHLAFELRDEEHLMVIVGTVRYLVDLPEAQESSGLMHKFCDELIKLLKQVKDKTIDTSMEVIQVLLDAISIVAMARDMQTKLASFKIDQMLTDLERNVCDSLETNDPKTKAFKRHVELAKLRCIAEVSIHPGHRLSWVKIKPQPGESEAPGVYPERASFINKLERQMKNNNEESENLKTIASLLLTIFQEEKFNRPSDGIAGMLRSVVDWWQGNSTLRFEEAKQRRAEEDEGGEKTNYVKKAIIDPKEKLRKCQEMKEKRMYITVMEASKYCSPHECVLSLCLFSRLALEPRFKSLFKGPNVLEAILGCICVGIWAEAREAAATLANLMWVPDFFEEKLVCWLKFDGPNCITVDASNVLIPLKYGHPRPVDIGKGMYKSSWGIEFVEHSYVSLHPEGLKTHSVPGLLTSASPGDEFDVMSKEPYKWLTESTGSQEQRNRFTISCWFYWPLHQSKDKEQKKRVLLNSSEDAEHLIFVKYSSGQKDDQDQPAAQWCLGKKVQSSKGTWEMSVRPVKKVPALNAGWHMLTIVSDVEQDGDTMKGEGTSFWLDDYRCETIPPTEFVLPNDFMIVGNSNNGLHPFGLITDFRIYAKALKATDVETMAKCADTRDHPDQICRTLADMDAATILAQRLDVPDSAAECLRALGSLAALSSQRAKIFSKCGRRILQMIESPLPMIKRQAARLINNIT